MMLRSAILLSGIILIALFGCLSRKVEHKVLERGIQSGAALSEKSFTVVNTREGFDRLYRQIHSGVIPRPDPPLVNFDESFILVISMGEKPTAGYAVEIGKVIREGSRLAVEVRFTEPAPDRLLATVVTRPYTLLRVERQPGLKSVVFMDSDGTQLASAPLNSEGSE